MRAFRESAVEAIEEAGMKTIYFDSDDPQKRRPLKPDVEIMRGLLDGVRTCDAFVGLYGQTLNTNWPKDSSKHSMELEYEAAQDSGIPCFCYVCPPGKWIDEDMSRLLKQVMQKGVGFLRTPKALHDDLLAQLKQLRHQIFVSYSSKDQNFVDNLYDELRKSGYRVWLNTESIPKSEMWYNELVKGLKETDLLILILSPDAVKSKWVKEEWKTFADLNKKVLPILHRECKIPKEINKIQIINARGEDDRWYYDLLKAIEQNL
jgi:hypothetical protein